MNEPIKTEKTDIMSMYQKSENILSDTPVYNFLQK